MTADQPPKGHFAVVAVASSAGGLHGLEVLLTSLRPDLPVPVLAVQHLDPRHRTIIAEILSRKTRRKVKLAEEEEVALPGTVYLAPPDRHLLVRTGGTLALSSSEVVHFLRPSADLLFESVADVYGPSAIACVLTGTGSDGSRGVKVVKSRGGTVLVQDPQTAEFAGMPEAAVASGAADHVLPLEAIATAINGLVENKRQ